MADEIIETTPTTDTASTSVRGTSILEQLGINSEDVLQSTNVASTLTNAAEPVSDALGIFQAQEDALGVSGLQAAADTATANYLDAQNLANQEQLTIQGRRKKLGVLRGEQAQAASQANVDLQTLLSAQTLAGNALSSAKATALQKGNILYNEYQQKNDLMLQYPGLDIDPLNDSFEDVSAKVDKYVEQQQWQAEKDAFKEALRALGLSTSGSKKKLEERLREANAAAYKQAQEDAALDRKAKEVSIQNTLSTIANRGNEDNDIQAEGTAGIESMFESLKGSDGYVSPSDWADAKAQWAKNKLSITSFNAIFGKYKNPNDQYN